MILLLTHIKESAEYEPRPFELKATISTTTPQLWGPWTQIINSERFLTASVGIDFFQFFQFQHFYLKKCLTFFYTL